VKRFINLV